MSEAAMAIQIQAMTEIEQQILIAATDAFDSEEKALRWLRKPNIQLDNQPPLSIIGTPEGFRAVEVVLNQIKYAIFA
jgi:putative toxin-antitoxin system antitoxin component (TIGR02293 family)